MPTPDDPTVKLPTTPPSRKRLSRKQIWWLVAIGLVVVLSMCICIATFSASRAPGTTVIPAHVATFTPTRRVATATPTATPMPTPTPRPTVRPTPTPMPTPTYTPTPHPTARPTPRPTDPPAPTTAPVQPVPTHLNNNPWGYDFTPGSLIYAPPENFCEYFACIAAFGKSTGYVVECKDDIYATSGGKQGSCSQHRGEWRPLYSH
jgi:hypothetical protein